MFDYRLAICSIRESYAESLRVFFRLLKAVRGVSVGCFGLDDGNHIVASVAKNVIRAFLLPTLAAVLEDHNSPVSESLLFADLIVSPAGFV